MFAQLYSFEPGQNILVPALPDSNARLAPVLFGASLTLLRGMALGRKTSDSKAYPFNKAASDGTQNFIGFNQVSGATDSNGVFYMVYGGTSAAATFYDVGSETGTMYTSGVFDPAKLYTSATGTAVAEVDTFTPATPTEGDTISVYQTATGLGVSIIVTATPSATTITTQLKNAWSADPALTAIAAATGTATFILTGVAANAGTPLGLTGTAVGTGTISKVVTTAAVQAQQAEIDTITPTGSVTTGDIYTVTINYPNGTTHAVSATVGATQSATGAVTVLKAAWAADVVASALATASGTATFILTGVTAGNALNLTASVVGTGTVSAVVVTKPALGRAITDIQGVGSRPGAYILQPYGYWQI